MEDYVTYSTRYDIFLIFVKESINCSVARKPKKIKKSTFLMEGGKFLSKVKINKLVDNENYEYDFDYLPLDKLCEIADELNE